MAFVGSFGPFFPPFGEGHGRSDRSTVCFLKRNRGRNRMLGGLRKEARVVENVADSLSNVQKDITALKNVMESGFSSMNTKMELGFASVNNRIEREILSRKSQMNVAAMKTDLEMQSLKGQINVEIHSVKGQIKAAAMKSDSEIQVLKGSFDFYSNLTLLVGVLSISDEPLFSRTLKNIPKLFNWRRVVKEESGEIA